MVPSISVEHVRVSHHDMDLIKKQRKEGKNKNDQHRLTKINVLQESEIQCRADDVFLVGVEDNLSSIVALLDGRKNICRIVGSVPMSANMASLASGLARGQRLEGLVRPAGLVSVAVEAFHCRAQRKKAERLAKKMRGSHF